MLLTFYTLPYVGLANSNQAIVLLENDMPEKSKSEEKKKQQKKEVFSFLFIIYRVAANPYADTNFILPAPIKVITLPPPDSCYSIIVALEGTKPVNFDN
jgi:hypothetical protein